MKSKPPTDGTKTESPPPLPLHEAVRSTSTAALLAAAADPSLGEDLALTLLRRRDLVPQVLECLGKNAAVMKYRTVKVAVVENPHTPRHLALAVLRRLFTFDLMQVAITPAVDADLKLAADEALINRLESVPLGERMSLARRASGRVAGALLLDPEPRIVEASLENPRLTEADVCKALALAEVSASLVQAVCRHSKWSLRPEIRAVLLRGGHLTPEQAGEFSRSLPTGTLREILHISRLSENAKLALDQELARRSKLPSRIESQ